MSFLLFAGTVSVLSLCFRHFMAGILVLCYVTLCRCVVGYLPEAPSLDQVQLIGDRFFRGFVSSGFLNAFVLPDAILWVTTTSSRAIRTSNVWSKSVCLMYASVAPLSYPWYFLLYADRRWPFFVVAHVSRRCVSRCACMAFFVGGSRLCTHVVGRCVVRLVLRPSLFLLFRPFLLPLFLVLLPQPVSSLHPPLMLL